MSEQIAFTVPLVPPGVNHYTRHLRNGRHYVTSEALKFKEALTICLSAHFVSGKAFEVELAIYLGSGQKGDVDGFPKLCLDALAKAGAFRNKNGVRLSDSHVQRLVVTKDRDIAFPRTEIVIRTME